MHVRLHELLDKVNLLELSKRERSKDIQDRNDILMVKVAEKLDLPKRTKSKHGVVEGRYPLDRYLSL